MPDERGFTHLPGGQIHARRAESDDEEIARLAGRQHGVVARRQLIELSISDRVIDHRLRAGRLRRLHPGVYAAGHEALSHPARALAAVMSASPGAAASHATATALLGLRDPPGGDVHVTAGEDRRARRGIVLHRAVLPPADLAIADRVPVTTVPRTLLDLSGIIDEQALRRLVKQAEFANLVDAPALIEILDRYPRRRGRRALARIVEGYLLGTGRTRSELEDRFLAFCAERGLPLPETNAVLEIGGRKVEVDCVWREARLVVELDGCRAHRTDAAFDDDRARDRILIGAGWLPMRVTWVHLHRDADTLETDIRNGLVMRAGYRRGFTHLPGG